MRPQPIRTIDGKRHILISFDVMVNNGRTFYRTVNKYYPVEYSLEDGCWVLDTEKINLRKDAIAEFSSLEHKEFTIEFNKVDYGADNIQDWGKDLRGTC